MSQILASIVNFDVCPTMFRLERSLLQVRDRRRGRIGWIILIPAVFRHTI
ncbi:MAG: hypothetical protein ACKVQJ_11360 [Pyrinomonadaceae bacterium]